MLSFSNDDGVYQPLTVGGACLMGVGGVLIDNHDLPRRGPLGGVIKNRDTLKGLLPF